MRRRDIYICDIVRVRDYEEMLRDPKLKADADGTIRYSRSIVAFRPWMKYLCGKTFMADGFRYDGSINTFNRNFRTDSGEFIHISPWMVEPAGMPYAGKMYEQETEQEPDPDIDREQLGLLFADLFGHM